MPEINLIIGIISAITLALLWAAPPASAANAGTTGAAFLELGIGARAAGRGYADVAWAEDVYGIYFNPAGVASLRRQQIGFTHNTLVLDLDYNFIGYAYPLKENGTIALSGLYVDLGTIERREIAAGGGATAVLGNANGWDFGFSATYARTMTDFLDLGVTVKLINESLDNYSASAIALDLGAKWRPPVPGFTVGVSLSNLGTRLKFVRSREELPITFRGGLGYRSPGGRWGLTGDLIYTKNQDLDGAIGGEVWVWPEHFVLRAGANSSADVANGFSLGAGFRWSDLNVDYAYVPFGDLGDQNLISLAYDFGPSRAPTHTERSPSRPSATTPAAQRPTRIRPGFLYGAAVRPFRFVGGTPDDLWLGEGTANVMASDWEEQGVSAPTWESARFRVEGTAWIADGVLSVSCYLTDAQTGQITPYESSGPAHRPFEVWRVLQQAVNIHMARQGLSVLPPAMPVPLAPLSTPRPAPAPVYSAPTAVAPPAAAPASSEPPAAPVAGGVTMTRIMEYGAERETERSMQLSLAVVEAFRSTGLAAPAATAAYRFEASYSEISDGSLVVYGKIIDRATGIPLGTIEVFGSPRNLPSLAARVADAVQFKIR